MKKILLTLTILLAPTVTTQAQQPSWHDISAYIRAVAGENTDFSDISCTGPNECWVSSSNKPHIYHTTDGGHTWEVQDIEYSINALVMRDSQNGYAGGEYGRVYRTTDGGHTWTPIGSIGQTLTSISCPPEGDSCYCCGDNGTIYGITGATAFPMESGVVDHLHDIFFPVTPSEGWVVGGSIIRHFLNNEWLGDQFKPSGGYNAIFMTDTQNGWSVGDEGIIIRTTNGANWAAQNNPDPEGRTLNGVFFLNGNEGWTVGFLGVILHTTDAGETWQVEANGMSDKILRKVQFISSDNGYVVGNFGTLLKYGYFEEPGEKYAKFTRTGENTGRGTFSHAVLPGFTWKVTGALAREVQILNDEVFDDGNAMEARFGQADHAENLRMQAMPNGEGTIGQPVTAIDTLTVIFDRPTPDTGWGFCVVDIDVENLVIGAIDSDGNEVPPEKINDWLVELFDANLSEYGINLPKWDSENAALLASSSPDDYTVYDTLVIGGLYDKEAPAAFFMPDMPLQALILRHENLQALYKVSYHFYIASENITAVEEHEAIDVKIYPNPAREEFRVSSLEFRVGGAVIELYDLNGRKMLQKTIPQGSSEITVDVSGLESGIYFCRITTAKGSVTKKVMVE